MDASIITKPAGEKNFIPLPIALKGQMTYRARARIQVSLSLNGTERLDVINDVANSDSRRQGNLSRTIQMCLRESPRNLMEAGALFELKV